MIAATRGRQGGAGLLEVLVATAVISVGVLAQMRFQMFAYRETGISTARLVAMELAAQKVEDLRVYSTLYTAAGTTAYADIATDLGGTLAAGSVVVGNQSFNRRWTVVNWYYPAAGSAPTTTVPAGSPLPSLKQVTVTLSWVDLDNQVQALGVSALIAAIEPRMAAGLYQ